jgi:hypothetical protein
MTTDRSLRRPAIAAANPPPEPMIARSYRTPYPTIVAARAGELIHEPALAMATGMFTGRLAATTHAYPTWSYAIQLAAAQFFGPVGGRQARPASR